VSVNRSGRYRNGSKILAPSLTITTLDGFAALSKPATSIRPQTPFIFITSRRHAACSGQAPQDDPMPKKKKFKLPSPNDRQALLSERRNMKMAESARQHDQVL
jgi:hypothetical protein